MAGLCVCGGWGESLFTVPSGIQRSSSCLIHTGYWLILWFSHYQHSDFHCPSFPISSSNSCNLNYSHNMYNGVFISWTVMEAEQHSVAWIYHSMLNYGCIVIYLVGSHLFDLNTVMNHLMFFNIMILCSVDIFFQACHVSYSFGEHSWKGIERITYILFLQMFV